MALKEASYRTRVLEEVEKIPPEYLAPLLKMVQAFRESVAFPTAEESLRRGWQEATDGDIHPVAELWVGLDDEQVCCILGDEHAPLGVHPKPQHR